MMKYFNDFVGKDLGFAVFAELMGYFSINMTPVAFPLAVLLSSLITFGNLGEHFELTAIKSAGISMTRILLPIFIFVVFLSIIAFLSNNYVVPKANIKAYALLYDIRQKKPSLDLKEGAFYNGIPGYSIKVNKKFPDNETLKDIIIYNHTKDGGNTDVIMADSGKMYTILNDRYMMLELFDGHSFSESQSQKQGGKKKKDINNFVRNKFQKSKLVFSLSTFEMQRSKEELFAHNRMMKDIEQLRNDIDSMGFDINQTKYELFTAEDRYYNYHFEKGFEMPLKLKEFIASDSSLSAQYQSRLKGKQPEFMVEADEEIDNTAPAKGKKKEKPELIGKEIKKAGASQKATTKSAIAKKREIKDAIAVKVPLTDKEVIDTVNSKSDAKNSKQKILKYAADRARYIMNNVKSNNTRIEGRANEIRVYQIEADKKYSQAVACIVLFLIGAPLGAIIKRGGLGVPVLLSITFFILYYVFTMVGEKWAKSEIIDVNMGVWGANLILLPLGLFFLRQARKDARLFDSDFYAVWINKFRKRLGEKSN